MRNKKKKSEVQKETTPPVPLTGEELQRAMRASQLTEEGRKELRETARIEALSRAHMHDVCYRN